MTVRSIKHFYIPNWVLDLGETFGLSHAQLLDVDLLSHKLTQVDLIKYLKASHDGLFLSERTSNLVLNGNFIYPSRGLGFPTVSDVQDVGALFKRDLENFMTYAWSDKEFTARTIGDELKEVKDRVMEAEGFDGDFDKEQVRPSTECIMFTPVKLAEPNVAFFTVTFYLPSDYETLLEDITETLKTYRSLGFTDAQIWGSELGKYIAHLYLLIDIRNGKA